MANTAEVTIKIGETSRKFSLNFGESKKGTYLTLEAPASKVIPFGKLYVDPGEFKKAK